jgi:ubiquinone/menaquinone biosynthesis C-methylase UbiE
MPNLTNADNHQGVIEKAKKNVLTATRFDVCDIKKLPYKADSYDLVLTILLLQHFQRSEYAKVFGEIE